MLGTSIIQRDLNAEVVNLGYSGEGRMDLFMAEAMASIPGVTAYVIDAVANCTHERLDTICEAFINILRKAHPEIPIFMAERHRFSNECYDMQEHANFVKANSILHRHYMALRQQNPKNIYYVDHQDILAPTTRAWWMVPIEPYLRAVLDGKKVPFQKRVNSNKYIVQ